MKGYKAFDKGMICNGKQYAENTVYEEQGGNICGPGVMHYCETPFDTWDYYPVVDESGDFTEYAEVEPLDEVLAKDNKRATKKLHIGAKLSFKDFIKAAISIVIETTKPQKIENSDMTDNGGDWAQIGSGGNRAKIGSSGNMAKIGSSGDWAKIGSGGNRAKIGSSGDWAKIGSSGDWAQIGSGGNRAQIGSGGDWAQIGSSGNRAQIGSSGDWAKIGSSGNMAKIGSSGNMAKIGSSGDWAKIGSSGDWAKINMRGTDSVGAAIGYNSVAKGAIGNWIVLAEWKKRDDGSWYPSCVRAGLIDGETIKADTWYKLQDGEFTEVGE